jgi:hypothetical protein
MNTQPTEFSFDKRVWNRLLLFLGGLFCIAGILVGAVSGQSWPSTLRWAMALPAIFTPLFWLLGCRSIHRSYVITADCIILRHRGRDLERIALTEIADVHPWPLAITLHSGRKISFYLARSEMERARDALLDSLPKSRNS